ncbi:interferon-related developmental regulator 2 isoform X3 [Falco biarmicus]|uniref:interferon-related developmental regulator 2 isoform X3 n=1 Tax=Falco rusticolus TaxID=120794 RepID=UPI0018865CB1|nr:interferon-related developmental regulator 2 isoform X3 [Falco rusticolus]XP_055565929.1 interferon-related developmental regulator 2 isoform X3 [Falco cherrug]XP_056193453.1 interferon-related developmental regulator 2 isoform X3 [Falco biarmicus]
MPRSRRAARRGPGSARAGSPASEEEAGSEVLSHCSSASEGASPAEEAAAGSEVLGEQGQEEVAEDRLKEHMDNLLDKSAKTRQAALQSLHLALSSRILSEFLLERRLMLTDSLEKCLKKGKGEEQALAGTVLTLLCLQMGSGSEGEEVFCSLKPLLVSVLTDSMASPGARQSCATALGMCCYIAAADLEDLVSCLSCLEGIFSPLSAGEGGSVPAQHGPLHCSALQSWSLLLTICPPSHIKSILDNCWLKLPPLLSSSSVALRILAGETIALVFELAQDVEEDLCHRDTEFLRAQLKVLATESNKYRAKTDRRKQRSIFRDILRFIESGEYQEETIRFGLECMCLDSWARQRTYQAFKENNELLREIFSLGPPLVLDAATLKASKVSRFEKHLYNSAAFKARTKARSRVRDKRADVL